jgi:hypothetical protein
MTTRLLLCAAAFLSLFAGEALGHSGARLKRTSLGIGQPFRIYPSNVTQTETIITRHPLNQSILFATANTINLSTAFISEGVYVSTNGGTSWWGNDTCTGALITAHGGEPAIAIDRNGRLILVRYGFNGVGLYSHFSTDNGRTWSSQRTITTTQEDRPAVTSDGIATSSFFGRTYAVWVRFASPYRTYFTYTDDGAANWTAAVAINNPSSPRCQGADIAIGPNGRVNVCWAAVIGTSPYTEDYIGFATSTNGGASWTVTENAFDVNGIQGTFPQKSNIRVNGLPRIATDNTGGPRNGWIYIVTTEKNLAPAGSDPDIIFRRSTNNGQTWSPAVRVNTDALNNGKSQYFPAIHVDNGGGINVLYYDDRGTTSDSATVYLARSTDGGNTWTDYRVTNYNFKPSPIGGLGQGYQGDNIGMTSLGNTLWPVWMDNSTGIYQIWTCPIDITTLDVASEEDIPTKFELHQNHPNPFNPSTRIPFSVRGSRLEGDGSGFKVHGSSVVTLKVYDVLGREVATLVDEEMSPGTYEVVWDASGMASGVYLYTMRAGDFVSTKKLVLLR